MDSADDAHTLSNGFAVVALRGELDAATAPDALARLVRVIDAVSARVIVQVSELDFLDSTGLRTLVSAHRLAGARGGDLVLVGAGEFTRRLLEITGLDDVLTNYPTVDDVS